MSPVDRLAAMDPGIREDVVEAVHDQWQEMGDFQGADVEAMAEVVKGLEDRFSEELILAALAREMPAMFDWREVDGHREYRILDIRTGCM